MVGSTASDGYPCKTIFIRDTGTHNALSKTTNSVRNFAMENGGRIIKMSTVNDGPFAKASEGKKSSRLIVKFDNGDTAQIDIIQGASETRFSVHADDGRDMFDDSNDVQGEARAVYDAWHNSDGSAKPGYMLAPNGKPTNLTERQWIQVRTTSFKKWFGDWIKSEVTKRWFDVAKADVVTGLSPVNVSSFGALPDKKSIANAFKSFGVVTNSRDGRSVRFPANSAGKMVYQKQFAAAFGDLFKTSVRAWSEKENPVEGHKPHANIENFHSYVNKFTDGKREFYIRFTVRENRDDGSDVKDNVHAAEISDVSVYEKKEASPLPNNQTGRRDATDTGARPHVDRKIAYFLDGIKDDSSKIVDENGEPKVFYHGTFENWTEYDLQKNVNQMWGNGIYLTPYPERARLYGDNIMAFYVKADTDYRTAKTTGKQKDYTVIKQTEDIIVYSPNQIKSATDNTGAFDEENPDIRYSLVTDEAKIKELEEGDTMKVYRAMQLVDGKLYPPMSGKVNGKWREPIQLGKWEQSEERPDLIGKDGKFKLNKGNGSTIGAAYNPYFHTSTSPLNDQFSSAYKRPELVTVEVEIPVSELTSGYKAKGAKDAVGKVDWHSGSTTASLGGRDVYLSRYDKPIRIVPESEVAKVIAERARGKNITFKTNTVTPKLKDALKAEGLRFDDMVDGGNRFSVHSDVGSAMFDDSNDVLGEARAVYDAWHDSDGNAKPGYMLAPNGKPTNLTERQWIQVRTPSFKKWFGDWESLAEIDHAVDFCLNGNPVSELTGKEFQKNGEHDLVDRITEFFKSIGGVVENNELGVVVLDRESVKSSIGHGIGRSKAAAFAAVPDVIRDGVLFDRQKNWKGRGTNTYVIAAPIRIGSENYVCEAIVEEKVGRKAERRFYLHEVNLQSTVSDTIKTPTGGVGIGNPSRPVRSILARKAVEFNRKDVSKVVDENGEPKVVYHGTPHGGHTVFNGSKNGSYSYSVDGTTFFSSSQNVAMSYSTDPKTKYSDLPKSAIEDARRYIDSSNSEVRKEDNGRFYVYLDGEYVANSDADTLETALEKAAVSIASSMEKNPDSMTYNVFLSVKNPVTVDFNGGSWSGERSADGYYDNSVPIIAERAKRSGHDGLIVKNVQDAANILGRGIADDYAVFSPSQIKSATDNTGAFDEEDDDIRYSIVTDGLYDEEKKNLRDAQTEAQSVLDRIGGTEIGHYINEDFRREGRSTLIGKRVSSARDLAALAQIYRNPCFETFRYFFTKNGEVVWQTGVTARLPGVTNVSVKTPYGGTYGEIERMAAKLKPDSVWLLHNHPSGNVAPSQQDIDATGELREYFDRLGIALSGHVIIDHDTYAELDKWGNYRPRRIDADMLEASYHGVPFTNRLRERGEPFNLGTIAAYAMKLQRDTSQPGKVLTLISLDNSGEFVTAVADIPAESIADSDSYIGSRYMKLDGFFADWRGASGGGNLFVVGDQDVGKYPAAVQRVLRRQIGIGNAKDFLFSDDGVEWDSVMHRGGVMPRQSEKNALISSRSETSDDGQKRFSIGGVYTGSAADYEKPSLHYVGTGEGNQVYGWGLYGSNMRGVAESYAETDFAKRYSAFEEKRRADSVHGRTKKIEFDGDLHAIDDSLSQGLSLLQTMEINVDDGIRLLRDRNSSIKRKRSYSPEDKARYIAINESIIRALEENRDRISSPFHARPRKQLYEQTFFTNRAPGDESHLLKWYDPVSDEQKKWIFETLEKERSDGSVSGENIGMINEALTSDSKIFTNLKGGEIYKLLSNLLGSPKAASEFLARAGIDGVKYPVDSYGKTVKDGDEAGWNYVSFRDDNIRVDHKWTDGQKRFSLVSTTTIDEFVHDPLTARWTIFAEPSAIRRMPSTPVRDLPPVTSSTDNNSVEKAIQKVFAGFGEVVNRNDGYHVVFNRSDAGKMMMQSGVDMRTFAPQMKHLFETSVHAFDNPQEHIPGHKYRKNVLGFRHYINKVMMKDGVEFFVRFTVREETGGRNGVHLATVSDVKIYNEKNASMSGSANKSEGARVFVDRIITRYLSKGNGLNRSDIRFSINIHEAGLSRAEAKAAIDTLKGKSYTNRETGISARLSSTGAGKLISNAATGKTQANGFSKEQHNALAAMIDELFENAYFVSSKPDDDGDKNIASIKRFVCPVTVADTEAGAYITIKESVQHGHRIYSVEGIKIEELSPMVRRVIADRNAADSSSSFSLPKSAYVVNPEEQNRDIQNLYIQASQNIPMLKDIAYRLCAKSVMGTASFRLPNREENDLQVKKRDTIIEKANRLYGGDVSQVVDIIAATVTLSPEDSYIDTLSSIDSETE